MYIDEFLLLKPGLSTWEPLQKNYSDWFVLHIDGLMQKRHNSISNALELRLFAIGLYIFVNMKGTERAD